MTTRYITTAIPYVNAAPHLGFALEIVQADTLARHARLRGKAVRFLTGTDDNALKNVTAAAAAGVEIVDFVAENARRFADLRTPLALSYDDFIRTSADSRHAPGVLKLWQRCVQNGDFYQRRYSGLYCVGCEQFYSSAELVDGRCPEHGTVPENVVETNWFFRLTRYQDRLVELIESDTVRITPVQRRNEVLAFLRSGLQDISVSRPAARSGGWGIPVPGDPDQVVWVWWDALGNYVTALGYGTDDVGYRDWWVNADERIHVIGKGVIRFHAVYWLAQLLSAGEPLPTDIVVHDYLTLGGLKISKSARNTVDPAGLSEWHGSDAVRWWLLSDVAKVGETDFTEERLVDRANTDLANGLGNLVNRSLTVVAKYRNGIVPPATPDGPFLDVALALPDRIDAALRELDFRAATSAINGAVEEGNRLIESEKPWELRRAEQNGDVAASTRLDELLAQLVAGCRVLAAEVSPFIPDGASRLAEQLGTGDAVAKPHPTFPRLELPR
jgi:methionyl-tRNA synthetase